MIRLPETPDQQQDKNRHKALVRYLMTLSEERRVMFMKNLKSDRLRLEIGRDLELQKAIRKKRGPSNSIYKNQS